MAEFLNDDQYKKLKKTRKCFKKLVKTLDEIGATHNISLFLTCKDICTEIMDMELVDLDDVEAELSRSKQFDFKDFMANSTAADAYELLALICRYPTLMSTFFDVNVNSDMWQHEFSKRSEGEPNFAVDDHPIAKRYKTFID